MGPSFASKSGMTRFDYFLTAAVAALVLAGCSMTSTSDSGLGDSASSAASASASAESDSATMIRLEREALALARTDGCDSVGGCRVAPVGAKACGGPRYWIPYCALSTDSAALFQKLGELRAAEQNFNQLHGVISDCSTVPAPSPAVSAGVCR